MRILFLLAFAFVAPLLSAQDEPAPFPVSGPEELRQHVEPAKVQVDRFLRFYDQGYFRSAENLMWKESAVVSRTADFYERNFGKFEFRELKHAVVANTYPPEADATFVIFHYVARFEKKRALPQKVVVRVSDAGKYEIAVFP